MTRLASLHLVHALAAGGLLAGLESVRSEPVLHIERSGWGDASPEDIRRLLISAHSAFRPAFPDLAWPGISVFRREDTPITLDRRDAENRVRIGLATRDLFWSQYVYQYGHELVHLIAGHLPVERRWSGTDNPVGWFEETLCEVGSLYTLRTLARSWEEAPPYSNWRDYRHRLAEYAQGRLEAPENRPPAEDAFHAWLMGRQPQLRAHCCDRAANTQVAARLLPVFERDPSLWRAVAHLRASPAGPQAELADHLRGWIAASPPDHHPGLLALAQALGFAWDP
jgi:hypothetical protein